MSSLTLTVTLPLCLGLPRERDFPGGSSGKDPTCQCRRHKRCRFDPQVGKIPWRREWQPTPVFLPGESHGQEEPGRLQSMGLQRVRHSWVTKHTDTCPLPPKRLMLLNENEKHRHMAIVSKGRTLSLWPKIKFKVGNGNANYLFIKQMQFLAWQKCLQNSIFKLI